MRLRFTRNARRHRIGKAHALHVMATVEPVATENERGELELSWVGSDDRGVELEIVAVMIRDQRADGRQLMVLVLHVMPTDYREG
jgi:hypothetical protein